MGIKILDLYSWVGKRCPTPYAYNCDIQTMKKGDPCQVHFDNRLADGPSGSKNRVPLFAARTLKCHRSIPGHSIAAVRGLKSSLWATAGGKGA